MKTSENIMFLMPIFDFRFYKITLYICINKNRENRYEAKTTYFPVVDDRNGYSTSCVNIIISFK